MSRSLASLQKGKELRKTEKMEFDFDNIELEPILKNEITGIVLSPLVDGQNQVVDAQEIKEAAAIWNQKFQHLTIQHRDKTGALLDLEELSNPETFKNCFDSDFEILSSYVVDTDSVLNNKSIPGGSWLLSLKVENPEIWELIKEKGLLSGFSIGALGIRSSNGVERISNLIAPEISLVANPANQRDFLIIKQLETILNPFISEFSCHLPGGDPDNFQKSSFRRMSRESGEKTLDIIVARPKGSTKTREQAYRYRLDAGWTKASSQAHCKRHKGTFHDIARKEE